MSSKEVFSSQIETKINKFDADSTEHKEMHRRYRYIVFFLAGVTSILSAAALSFDSIQTELNFIIVGVGAIIGFYTSVEGLRKPHDLWIMERNVYYALLDLKEEYEFKSAGNARIDIDEYFSRMQKILSASQEKWTRQASGGKKGGKAG